MQQKKTTQEEYQKCVNAVIEYINQHLGEDIDLKSLARISNFSPFYFHRIMKACRHVYCPDADRSSCTATTLLEYSHSRYCLSDRIFFAFFIV